MTGSVALDIVIGLVFIYLLYSLLVSIIQEGVANMFDLRAKFLQKALVRMLEEKQVRVVKHFGHSFLDVFRMFGRNKLPSALEVANAFYDHPHIKYLAEDDYHRKPSYLKKQEFSSALFDLLRGNDFAAGDDPRKFIEQALNKGELQWKNSHKAAAVKIQPKTLSYLNALWAESQGDAEKFRTALENWFDATMERTTGWYKKHTQALLLLIGFVVAGVFNVDTIKIVKQLSNDPVLRNELVKQADNYVKTHQNDLTLFDKQKSNGQTPDTSLAAIKKEAERLTTKANELINNDIKKVKNMLAIGWSCKCNAATAVKTEPCSCSNFDLTTIPGWLITALALSLGAPFWFDLLSKLMKIRGSVSPSNATDQPGKSQQAQETIKPKG